MPLLLASLMLTAFAFLSLAHSQPIDPEISLQWAICGDSAETVLEKLGYPNESPYKSNPIVYYDTWPPVYTPNGIAFRTKVKKHDPGWPISMIKARFGEFNENVPSDASCVWNRYGNDSLYTCGLSSLLSEIGGAEGESLWSAEQMAFAQRYEDVHWEDLMPYGPYMNPKWKVHILGRKAVFDDVRALPLHLMEVEIVVGQSEGASVYDEFGAYLREKGVVLCEKQLPKTLRLFEHLQAEAANEYDGGVDEQVVLGQQ